jgi:hypothetical protein
MGTVQLFLAAPLYQWWPVFFSPGIPAEIAVNPFAIMWLVIFVAITLTPICLLGATVALIIKPLSPESRGMMGFLMIIGGIIPTILLFVLLALSSS